MATGQHELVKAQKIIDTGLVALEDKLVIAHTVTKESMDQFKGVENDTISFRVPGTLPVRSYGWKNDRTQPIKSDEYRETKVDLTINPNNDYSAVKIIDEALDFDFEGKFGRVLDAQVDTVAEKVEHKVFNQILAAPYEAHLTCDPSAANIKAQADLGRDLFYNWFADVRATLNKLRAPGTAYYAIVGSEIASHLRKHAVVTKHAGSGEGAFSQYVIGNYAGITCIEDLHLPADEGYVYDASGFVLFTAAPAIPRGAHTGATANKNGISMRWLFDYDVDFQVDRSTLNSWNAQNYVKDRLKQINEDETQLLIGTEDYFLRGVKISLGADGTGFVPGDGGAADGGRAGASATSELAKVWNGQPFTGTLPAGEGLSQTLLAANAYADANDAGAV